MTSPRSALPKQDQGYRWWVAVRNSPIVRRRTHLEDMLSFPVGAESELRFFHYRVITGIVWRPFTIVTAKLPDLIEIELRTHNEEVLFPNLLDDKELGPFIVQERSRELRDSLLNLQPLIMQRFPNQKAGALGEQYLELFNMLTPDVLKPFYHALNPDYFEWLKT